MLKRKRWYLVRVLTLLFAAAIAYWTVKFPYRPDRLYRAVPGNAIWIGEHRELTGRWREALASPLADAIAEAAGVSIEPIRNTIRTPLWDWLVGLLAGRHTLLVYSPMAGPIAAPTWSVISWVGGHTQLLRAGIPGFWMKRHTTVIGPMNLSSYLIEFSGSNGDDPVWYLSLSGHEGVAVLSYSTSPDAAAYSVARIRSDLSFHPKLPLSPPGWTRDSGQSDWLWGLWTDREGVSFVNRELRMRGAIDPRRPIALAASINPTPFPQHSAPLPAWRPAFLDASSDMLLSMRLDALTGLLDHWIEPQSAVQRLLDDASRRWGGDATVFVALLNDRYTSEFMSNFPLPVLLIGLAPSSGAAEPLTRDALIENMCRSLDLSFFASGVESDVVRGIEESNEETIFRFLHPGRRPGIAQDGDWTLLCTDRSILASIVNAARQEDANERARPETGLLTIRSEGALGSIGGWLVVSRLVMSLAGEPGDDDALSALEIASRVVAAFQPVGEAELRLKSGPPGALLFHFLLTPASVRE